MTELERVVQVTLDGRVFTFTVERDPPLSFWRVSTPGRPLYRSPLRVTGDEELQFFREVAIVAASQMGTANEGAST